ncbi:MAG: hypothetical protein ABJH05_08235 [Fulvivirga sp.]
MPIAGNMRFVPSPIPLEYRMIYSATANESGRMQYHKIIPGKSKERISRTEFVENFNSLNILAVRPLPVNSAQVFQFEFYV